MGNTCVKQQKADEPLRHPPLAPAPEQLHATEHGPPMKSLRNNPMGDQLQQAKSEPEVFLLYEGGEVAEELRSSLTHVRIAPHVNEIQNDVFSDCDKLIDLQLNEGLRVIGERAFQWTALRSVTLPSSVTALGHLAFHGCSNLSQLQLNEGLQIIGDGAFRHCRALRIVTLPSSVTKIKPCAFLGCSILTEVQLNEGLQIIGSSAFSGCTALRSMTIPSTVTDLSRCAPRGCSDLSEVIFLGGKRLLNYEVVNSGFWCEGQGLLDKEAIDEMLFDEYYGREFPFSNSLTTVKISISWALSERIERLLPECRVPVSNMILNLQRLDLMQNGNVLACFPVVCTDQDEYGYCTYGVLDTNVETARSLYRVLQLIAFHELKESSILIELALWKSIIDMGGDRTCRVAIPGPAKILLMEYCGFAGFLRPAF
ncbi:hypothetical protein THAOC_07476 [Thalassiosira oceanica]|uniref:Uncharacterized protein n=1 Tax=Thalassiosira oceanica TaxID=159749 RepID=K0TKC6_THAOC|nr:hypothetical protein THAOC_07476 [Thalassiosira oceanica]|eukprot:EJK71117.1 hypothetical protein THAOC_07476 [Thalassiosira oceanica]